MYLLLLIRRFLALLGPDPNPPDQVVRAAAAVVRRCCPDLADRVRGDPCARQQVFDVALAYGCGFGRVPIVHLEGWGGLWPKAFARLTRLVLVWVRRTNCWLRSGANVGGLEAALAAADDEARAFDLAALLVSGGCRCYAVDLDYAAAFDPDLDLTDSDSNLARRFARCCKEHRLLAWNPAEMRLSSFIARAVKGAFFRRNGRGISFSLGALVQGMCLPLLTAEIGLRAADVLVWRCPAGHDRNFFGLPCHTCLRLGLGRIEADPRTKLTTVRWLLLPSDRDGAFSSARYWRCRSCGGFFPDSRRACPADGAVPGRGAKPTVVWFPTQTANVALDAEPDPGDEPGPGLQVPAPERDADLLALLIDLSEDMSSVPRRYRAELKMHLESIFQHPVNPSMTPLKQKLTP